MQGLPLTKLIDMPPLWLALFVALARVQAVLLPVGPPAPALLGLVAGLMVGGGVLLALVALVQMRQAQTTVVPHLDASALVTNGVFARSRNPIYLGDALVLAGLILWWGAWPSLILVPLFGWVITDRFILPEEARLRARFGPAFEAWAARTRRWV
jgi:protein-S-isoprenylcysteine O-methyltransferase Ste14